ncbi:hypothetical protein Fmac_024296 [Flemingia macrophylla]|uniref:Uncharacterized protein n=1 Tax=Flemingia macrophylla TaxID=520843 RepID=A0ABD1LP34_9FABA
MRHTLIVFVIRSLQQQRWTRFSQDSLSFLLLFFLKKIMSSSSICQGNSLSNLERFLLCVTPDVPSRTLQSCGNNPNFQPLPLSKDTIAYITLKDLWDCYYEWSAHGAGIPLMLDSGDTVTQYYVPYLSAIQIYTNKFAFRTRREDSGTEFESDSWSDDSGSDNLSGSLSNNSSKAWDIDSLDSSSDQAGSWPTKDDDYLYLQYNETSPPYKRVPFMEKITELTRSHPALMTLRSVDISPSCWMAVAWYPIYSVPCQKNKKDHLSASFLTFHALSSPSQDCAIKYDAINAGKNTSYLPGWRSIIREKCMKQESGCIPLSPFGVATYKMRKDMWSNPSSNHQGVSDLYNAADLWLKNLNVDHHDFKFFKLRPTL